jgi:putative PEP-CTERM system histidine kinase
LSLLLTNAEKHRSNPDFQKDMLDTLDHSVKKMKLLLQKLGSGKTMEAPAPLALDQLLQQAVALKSGSEPRPSLEIIVSGLQVVADWTRLERVIGHLIQNAVEATARDGQVMVSLVRQGSSALIEVRDTGLGMSEDFIRERLFKPFETTKSAGMGIGVFESREYIHELGGRLEVESRCSVGTTFRIRLPLHGTADSDHEKIEQEESA